MMIFNLKKYNTFIKERISFKTNTYMFTHNHQPAGASANDDKTIVTSASSNNSANRPKPFSSNAALKPMTNFQAPTSPKTNKL